MAMKVGTKLLGLGGIGAVVVLTVAAGGYWGVARLSAAMGRVSETAAGLRTHVEADMMHDALRGDVLAALLADTPEAREQVKKDIKEHSVWFRECLEQNARRPLGEEARRAMVDAGPALDAYIATAERLVAHGVADPKAARAELPEFMAAFGELETKMEAISDVVQASADRTGESARTGVRASMFAVLGLGGAGLAGLALGSWLVARSIVVPLRRCVTVLGRLAAGDLTPRVGLERDDEMGDLGRSADAMAESMTAVVAELKGASAEVVSAASQITSSSRALVDGAEEQSGQMAQTSASVDEMSSSIVEVARQSSEAAATASESGQAAKSGGEVVEQTIEGLRAITESFESSAAIINELGQRGEQIGRIVGVINDIADQTNLLALNAAIEAARAGEHGRGFAVVADEVRKLADRTTSATGEIAESIKAMQSQTQRAVEQTRAGTERVRLGTERAARAGESLVQIVGATRRVATMIEAIAAAAEEQSAASERIAATVKQMTEVMEMSRGRVDESATAAASLTRKAEHLQELVQKFKVAG
ncbi:MAG: methyl-accepting chemotaxis protein [Phycisphaerales bacterium]|nr:methyl-accepting chemotaxis protein [Phycisphaerales bacterium]